LRECAGGQVRERRDERADEDHAGAAEDEDEPRGDVQHRAAVVAVVPPVGDVGDGQAQRDGHDVRREQRQFGRCEPAGLEQ
jgi:hypothetical protein